MRWILYLHSFKSFYKIETLWNLDFSIQIQYDITNKPKEDVPEIFKPLLVPFQVSIQQEDDELDLTDVAGLDPEIVRVI